MTLCFRILGCGSSGGVPRLGGADGAGNWGVCDPAEPKNRRSRCSLLCGELKEGTDAAERSGFVSLIRKSQLQPTGNVPDPIFHKAALDAVPSGLSLATDVYNAIADVAG